jgi:hypothetical protein
MASSQLAMLKAINTMSNAISGSIEWQANLLNLYSSQYTEIQNYWNDELSSANQLVLNSNSSNISQNSSNYSYVSTVASNVEASAQAPITSLTNSSDTAQKTMQSWLGLAKSILEQLSTVVSAIM